MDTITRAYAAIKRKIDVGASYKAVFETPDGQRVLQHLMRVGFVTSSTFVVNDPQQTALNEGSRRIVLSIIKKIGTDDSELIKQMEESLNEK